MKNDQPSEVRQGNREVRTKRNTKERVWPVEWVQSLAPNLFEYISRQANTDNENNETTTEGVITGCKDDSETGNYTITFDVDAEDVESPVRERMEKPHNSLRRYRFVRLVEECDESLSSKDQIIGKSVPFKHTGERWRPDLPSPPSKRDLELRRQVAVRGWYMFSFLFVFAASSITYGVITGRGPDPLLLVPGLIFLLFVGIVSLDQAVEVRKIDTTRREWFGQ